MDELLCSTQYFKANKKTSPRSCLRWKPTGRIFKTVGLRNQGSKEVKCDEHEQMASGDNTSGPAPLRKEKCTIQCALSSKEEKSLSLNLLKKGLLIREEDVEASKRRRSLIVHKTQQLFKGSSEGFGIIPEVHDEPKENLEVAKKQAGNVQTSLTLSSAKLEIQSMVEDGNPARANIKQALGRDTSKYSESNVSALEDLTLGDGNPVKELYDDVDIRLNEPVDTDKGFVQEEGTNSKTDVLVTSSFHSSDLAAKFLNFLDIPHTDAEIVSPLDVYVHHEFNKRVITLEKEVVELKKDVPLKTQVNALVDKHLDAWLGATRYEFMNFLLASITARITEQVKNQLPQILPKEVSNFAPLAASTLTKFELKKILIDKMDKSESYLAAPKHKECYEVLKKSYDLDKTIFSTYGKVYSLKRIQNDKDEDPSAGSDQGLKKRKTSKDADSAKKVLEFEVADSNMLQDQEENPDSTTRTKSKLVMTIASFAKRPLKTFDELMITPIDFYAFIINGLNINNLTQETLLGPAFRLLKGRRSNYAKLEYDFEECYKALSEKLNWENPEGDDYPFDITKPIPLVMIGNRQNVPVDYFFNNDLKYLQGGVSTITYTNSITKTKALGNLTLERTFRILLKSPMINMVPNIWSNEETWVWVSARDCSLRANNDLYRFKEGDFPRLCINDIEDMLLFVVQNRLTHLSCDDVSDFTIALRMFTRSVVIQKRVKDLQLRVESYQKKINVTKPEIPNPELGNGTHTLHMKTLKD
uniref:Uncharacterized protein n=1 Tax=Tanacetum cinerariifolium TaxID=118510 RepID=A0A6L2LFR9_TANCI|nr:hypothetical protein [Tanacetum cinerariifolium]